MSVLSTEPQYIYAQRDGLFVSVLESNADAFLVAIPMVVVLIAALFRLDELWCRTPKAREAGRRLSNWDENGIPICTDPGPMVHTVARREHRTNFKAIG
jgi:hypothetical protein